MKLTGKPLSTFFLFPLIFIFLTVGAAKAEVFTVTNLENGGGGSLRQAIIDANNATGGQQIINFQAGLTGTINLLSPLPDLLVPMSINGPGPDLLTVRRDAPGAFRIFGVTSNVELNGLTITGGTAPNTGSPKFVVRRGSGISVQGSLVLNNCRVTGNSAGGAITEGGGIYNTGVLIVRNSEVTNNTLLFQGGAGHNFGSGIFNQGIATIENSTISGNSGTNAILNYRFMTISRSSVTNNIDTGIFSLSQGGGANSILIENSTISGNGYIGAWLSSGSPIEIRSSTIANNQDVGFAGAALLNNSIIAGNGFANVSGGFTANSSYNLISFGGNLVNGQNGNIVGTSQAPVNAQLAPLGNYGGRTQTHRLLHTSPAINAGNPIEFPATDQRGVVRPVGGSSDIGAFEFNLTPHRILPRGGLNAVYNQTLTAFSDVPEPVFLFNVPEGALPPGITLVQTGTNTATLTGTPTAIGTFNFTITATNAGGFTISASYSLTIQQIAASLVAVRGRVLTNDGKPVRRAVVLLFDANGNVIKQAFTNPFGYYRFHGVQTGEIYSFKVVAKNRRFTPQQNVTLNGELNDFNFIADP